MQNTFRGKLSKERLAFFFFLCGSAKRINTLLSDIEPVMNNRKRRQPDRWRVCAKPKGSLPFCSLVQYSFWHLHGCSFFLRFSSVTPRALIAVTFLYYYITNFLHLSHVHTPCSRFGFHSAHMPIKYLMAVLERCVFVSAQMFPNRLHSVAEDPLQDRRPGRSQWPCPVSPALEP